MFTFSEELDIWVHGNAVLDQNFQPEFNDLNSEASINLKNDIIGNLHDEFCDGIPICEITITGFREGSVIVDFLISISKGIFSDCDVLNQLHSQMSSLPTIFGGTNITPGSLSTGKSLFVIFIALAVAKVFSETS